MIVLPSDRFMLYVLSYMILYSKWGEYVRFFAVKIGVLINTAPDRTNKDKEKGISLHTFPKDPYVKKWVFICFEKEGIRSCQTICSLFYTL